MTRGNAAILNHNETGKALRVFQGVGGVPQVGDTIEVDGTTLTVESTDGRRVGKVLVVRRPDSGDAADDAEA
jgi:magnesium and cobalt exporter, CNNM family